MRAGRAPPEAPRHRAAGASRSGGSSSPRPRRRIYGPERFFYHKSTYTGSHRGKEGGSARPPPRRCGSSPAAGAGRAAPPPPQRAEPQQQDPRRGYHPAPRQQQQGDPQARPLRRRLQQAAPPPAAPPVLAPAASRVPRRGRSPSSDSDAAVLEAAGYSTASPSGSPDADAGPMDDEEARRALAEIDALLEEISGPPPAPRRHGHRGAREGSPPPPGSPRSASPVGAAHAAPSPQPERDGAPPEPLWRALRRAAWHPSRPFAFPYEEDPAPYDPGLAEHIAEMERVRSAAALSRYEQAQAEAAEGDRRRADARAREIAARRDRALERELRRAQERQQDVDDAIAGEAEKEEQLLRAIEREQARVAEAAQRDRDRETLALRLDYESDQALDAVRDRELVAQGVLGKRVARAAERRRLRSELDALEARVREGENDHRMQDAKRQEWLVAALCEVKEGYLRQLAASAAFEEGRRMRLAARRM